MTTADFIGCEKDDKGVITDCSIRFTSGKNKGLIIRMKKDLFDEFLAKGKVQVSGYLTTSENTKVAKKPKKNKSKTDSKITKVSSPYDF